MYIKEYSICIFCSTSVAAITPAGRYLSLGAYSGGPPWGKIVLLLPGPVRTRVTFGRHANSGRTCMCPPEFILDGVGGILNIRRAYWSISHLY